LLEFEIDALFLELAVSGSIEAVEAGGAAGDVLFDFIGFGEDAEFGHLFAEVSFIEWLLEDEFVKVLELGEDEYQRARWQRLLTISSAMIVGVGVAFGGILHSTKTLNWFSIGVGLAIGSERVLNAVLKDGHKMSTQRMKVYPHLRDYRKRQQQS
jgi:hypothetical protein